MRQDVPGSDDAVDGVLVCNQGKMMNEMENEMEKQKCRLHRWIAGPVLLVILLGTAAISMAAEKGKISETATVEEMRKFQVVAGSDDKAYLVDTVTGAVWVLTYRTMATGREPIAIPYKFILRTPKNQGEFLAESAGSDVSMPPNTVK